jgi:hypothetical protein
MPVVSTVGAIELLCATANPGAKSVISRARRDKADILCLGPHKHECNPEITALVPVIQGHQRRNTKYHTNSSENLEDAGFPNLCLEPLPPQ